MDWYITSYLFTHQLLNICVILTFWLQRIMLIILCKGGFNFLGCLPKSGIAGSYSTLWLPCWGTAKYCSKWLDHFIFLASVYEGSSSILGTYRPGEFIFQCPIFLPFHTVHGVLKARILKWFAFPSPVDNILSGLSTITRPSLVAPHGMA